MISKDDIKKLADLARIEIKEEEQGELAGEMDQILEYIGQIKNMTGESKEGVELGDIVNVMRDDVDPTESGIYSQELIAEFPDSENNYLKVKKIL